MNEGTLSIWEFIMPWLIPPGIIGLLIFIYGKYRANDFARWAALLTLKPLVATPLWLLISQWYQTSHRGCEADPAYFLTAAPGIGITLLLIFLFRKVVRGLRGKGVGVLLILDTIRWGNSILFYPQCYGIGNRLEGIVIYTGLVLPTIFALVVLGLCFQQQHEQFPTHPSSLSESSK